MGFWKQRKTKTKTKTDKEKDGLQLMLDFQFHDFGQFWFFGDSGNVPRKPNVPHFVSLTIVHHFFKMQLASSKGLPINACVTVGRKVYVGLGELSGSRKEIHPQIFLDFLHSHNNAK